MILLDTHVVLWLFDAERQRLPLAVQRRIQSESLAVSPMVLLELGYMFELNRTRHAPEEIIRDLTGRTGLVVLDVSMDVLCRTALGILWTRDPFDRLIAAHAVVTSLTLVTKDQRMRLHFPLAWWED